MQNFLHEEKIHFLVRLNHYILLTTSVWKLNSLLANIHMVWKWCLKILFLNLILTVLLTQLEIEKKNWFHTIFVTHRHSLCDSQAYCKKSLGFYNVIWFNQCCIGCTVKLRNCQNNNVLIFFKDLYPIKFWWVSEHDAHLA